MKIDAPCQPDTGNSHPIGQRPPKSDPPVSGPLSGSPRKIQNAMLDGTTEDWLRQAMSAHEKDAAKTRKRHAYRQANAIESSPEPKTKPHHKTNQSPIILPDGPLIIRHKNNTIQLTSLGFQTVKKLLTERHAISKIARAVGTTAKTLRSTLEKEPIG